MFNFFSPLEQFEIFPLFSYSFMQTLSIFDVFVVSNLDIAFMVASLELIFILILFFQDLVLFPNHVRHVIFSLFDNGISMVRGTVGLKGKKFFPIFITIFIYILILNVLGLIPFGFCVTSQIIITQLLGFYAVFGLTFKGLQLLGPNFLNLFVPRNVPFFMLPFLSIIEIVSYISRMFSLSIRLFANMVAGHALIHILMAALLGATLLNVRTLGLFFLVLVPGLIIFVILILEMGIAFLQAYVFSVLFLIYLNDSCKSH